ncbi:MAG: GntR family transcriptional regulator [Desulfobacteraceae bacterium]|nr:GntR family transcriptional regulator [Desulfobacteraceae bacterium]
MTITVSSLSTIKPPPSLAEIAFKTLKDAIISSRLEPGEIYSEQVVARELGISKTPVHQALVALENKGFVSILSRKGFRVNPLTEKNIRHLFAFRRPLETAVIRHVIDRMSDESHREIKILLDRIAQTRDPVQFQGVDRAFHRYLASVTENKYIINALNGIWDLCDWVGARVLYNDNVGLFEEATQEHIAIAEMLEKGDKDGAVEAMERHLILTEKKFLAHLEKEKK